MTVELGRLCHTCADGWSECARCRYHTPTTWRTDTGDRVCPACVDRFFDRCAACSLYTADSRYVSGGFRVCSRCAQSYSSCEECGTLLPEHTDCESCESDGRIWNYNYKPDPRFFGHGPMFFGLELEIVVPSHNYQTCASMVGDYVRELAYLKYDSSIEPLGFELVTHPMDYRFAIEKFPWQLIEQLKELGCRSDQSVGIHVHVSRDGFDSAAHIFRWAKLIYRNEPQTVALARRRSPFAQFSTTARERVKHTAKDDMRRYGLNRYQAINPHPRKSLELRVFAGSLDIQQVQAALAFAAATVEYTRTLTSTEVIRQGGWDWNQFTAWVNQHEEYAPLRAEMEALACAS
ncbi:amidoligase family protein [Nocardia sp. SYP-A9097]|uniref:amidoligase family protein n=1 Tax=Nocardia sp. SYP-A9097 TaxID=2663237 RepID=UPI001E5A93CA|nr:amidoligase family protein [Nocardia sp. SYP-A9097]